MKYAPLQTAEKDEILRRFAPQDGNPHRIAALLTDIVRRSNQEA
jgi:hypothetical protein